MPDISEFVAAAGASLLEGQDGLIDEDTIPRMAIADARLDAKVALEASDTGLKLQTISLGDITSGAVESSALSTIRISFVAYQDVKPIVSPTLSADEVIGKVAGLDDVVRLDEILGGLTYRAEFISSQSKWLVVAQTEDTLVRQVFVEDGR